jgi:flagellar basal body-associated protein FliL
MPKFKNLVIPFVAIAAAIGIFSFFILDKKNSQVKFSPEGTQQQQQTKSEPNAEIQPAPAFAGQDPFKKFLDEKAGNANLVAKSNNSLSLPDQPGKDPFKEFLDKRQQNSKDQVVSPFGKN